ncbi:MAG: monovalent cation:proton antiporter-2 (CPA2) family protein [Luteolibacter sp.]
MAFENAFQQAFIYLSAAILAALLGKQLKLGAVLGYLIIGAAIGPWGFHFTGDDGEQVTHFAEFGVVVMLFLIGLELEPAMLWKMRKKLVGLGSFQVVGSTLAIAGVIIACGLSWKPALALGAIFTLSSTAIVLQTLAEKNLLRTEAGQNSFAVLLFQDIAVIPIIALLPLLGNGATASHGHSETWISGWPLYAQALATLGAVALIIGFGRIGMRHVFRAIARTRQREAFTGAALLLVIGVALLMTKVGMSPALGAFVAGVVLAGSEYRHELESDLDPFKGILLGIFFLGVGAAIDFGYISEHLLLVIGGALGLIAVKGLLLYGLSRIKARECGAALLFSAALATGGEFAFVLITLALGSGVFSEEIGRAAVAIVALSMATTPLLILAAQRFITSCVDSSGKTERESDATDEGHPVIICGFGRFGHAIGRLLRSRGFGCTVLDHDSDQVELLRNVGIPIFYGDASRPEMLGIAGADRAKILVITLKNPETTLKIIENARRHHPHLKIFIRAYSRVEAYEYLDSGEEQIYRDTLDSSLRLGSDVLQFLGETPESADRAAKLYRDRDELMVREMARHRHNSEQLHSAAREAHRSLDEIMRRDLGLMEE